jgi:hypothetical protein
MKHIALLAFSTGKGLDGIWIIGSMDVPYCAARVGSHGYTGGEAGFILGVQECLCFKAQDAFLVAVLYKKFYNTRYLANQSHM